MQPVELLDPLKSPESPEEQECSPLLSSGEHSEQAVWDGHTLG